MSRSYRRPCYDVCCCSRGKARYWKRLIRHRIRAAAKAAYRLGLDPPSEKMFRDPRYAPDEGKGLWKRGYFTLSPPEHEELDRRWIARLSRK